MPPLLLSSFQHARHFTTATQRRYTELGATLPFVCAIGTDMQRRPAPQVHGAAITADDPLAHELTVIVLGAHFAGALIARDLGDSGPDLERRFAYLVTHHRPTIINAARTIAYRLVN